MVEPATDADDAALRRLLAASPMDGAICLAFEREPSYFDAVRVQGRFAQVIVGRDVATGEVVGAGSRTIRSLFVNGHPRDVGYLGDLRLLPAVRGGTVLARGYRLLRAFHADRHCELYYTVIAADNRPALTTLASGRAGLPAYRDLGGFVSAAIDLGCRLPPLRRPQAVQRAQQLEASMTKEGLRRDVEIAAADATLLDGIVACLNEHGRSKQFAPVYERDDFASGRFPGFRIEDFFVAVRGGRVVGTLGLWDQQAFKQTRVVGYRGALRVLRPLLNLGAPLLGRPRLPRPGASLRAVHAAFVAVAENDLTIFRALLRQAYHRAAAGPHAHLLVGLHERDPLLAALDDYRATAYRGRLFCVHFDDGEAAYRALDARVPHVELATL